MVSLAFLLPQKIDRSFFGRRIPHYRKKLMVYYKHTMKQTNITEKFLFLKNAELGFTTNFTEPLKLVLSKLSNYIKPFQFCNLTLYTEKYKAHTYQLNVSFIFMTTLLKLVLISFSFIPLPKCHSSVGASRIGFF